MHDHEEVDDLQMLESMRWEQRDLGANVFKNGGIALVIMFVIGIGGAYGMFITMNKQNLAEVKDAKPFDVKVPEPYPSLQTNVTAKTDIQDLRHAEAKTLTSYGVSPTSPDTYRVPVDRAIEILAAKGSVDGGSR